MPTTLPSALERLDDIVARLGRPVVFSDYDGTLTPIVDDPDAAYLDPETRSALVRLSECCPVGVVSGRDLADVRSMVAVDGLVYAGSHGFQIVGPSGFAYTHPDAHRHLPALDAAEAELSEAVEGLDGVRVERKRFALAVHTRLAADDDVRESAGRITSACAARHPGLRLQPGKEVLELRPDLEWDKGRAVGFVLDTLGRSPAEAVYLGDDRTDEDAFEFLRRRGGIGVLVGDPTGPSAATHRLDGPEEVRRFLTELAGAAC